MNAPGCKKTDCMKLFPNREITLGLNAQTKSDLTSIWDT